MSEPCIGSIRIFPFNFAPEGWAFCNGQLLSISQNTTLFSLLGTTYGGDGKSTFGLPNLQGCIPICYGAGPGTTTYALGQEVGQEAITLNISQLPTHTHAAQCIDASSNVSDPTNAIWTKVNDQVSMGAYSTTTPLQQVAMSPVACGTAGGSQPHDNIMPSIGLNFCIALQGVYPSRS